MAVSKSRGSCDGPGHTTHVYEDDGKGLCVHCLLSKRNPRHRKD